MSKLYKRMLLIRPNVFEKFEKGASSFSSSSSEHVKDSLSPIAPTVNVLEHLQKEMARVLKDLTMDTEEKLATYNDLMTRSQILTSKAKSMTT